MPDLTAHERSVLHAVRRGIADDGRAPTGPDLAQTMGVSYQTVYRALRSLEERGLVAVASRGRGVPLQIRLTDRGRAHLGSTRALPRFGRIPAGPLTDVVAQADDFVSGIADVMPWIQEGDFLLEVQGDSMINAGLRDGMTIVLRHSVAPNSGDICSVYVDGEGATLKRVDIAGDQITLRPENPAYQPQTVPAESVTIQGVLIGALDVLRFR